MTNHVMNSGSVETLQAQLANPTIEVYLVVANTDPIEPELEDADPPVIAAANEDPPTDIQPTDAWYMATSELGDYARTDLFLARNAKDVAEWSTAEEISGWPVSTGWEGGIPTAICFGFSDTPQYFLTKEQAESRPVVDEAFFKTQGDTTGGTGA